MNAIRMMNRFSARTHVENCVMKHCENEVNEVITVIGMELRSTYKIQSVFPGENRRECRHFVL